MKIEIGSCTHSGGREYNEDNVRYSQNGDTCAVVIADGLGGHGGGQIASEITAETLVKLFMKTPTLQTQYIRDLFNYTNSQVLAVQTPGKAMKSTGVVLYIHDGSAMWAHAGDSRLYCFEKGRLTLQTLDHSVSQTAVFAGEITQDEIRFHEDRNRVLRAFGGDEQIKAEVSEPLDLKTGQVFLLCTDGFWEYVLESEMQSLLAECAKPCEWLSAMTEILVKRAPQDNDNFSAAAVFVTADHPIANEGENHD
jgi:serine/threonine protein phosphatase PrpC